MSDRATAGKLESRPAAFRVLVVDDDPDMAAFLARLLAVDGIDADTVGDGETALARVARGAPDLILLDVMLPGTDGFVICERLKGNAATAMIPIVLVTALEDQASRVRGIRAGADDFLSKPVKREELLARVGTLRKLHETRRELEAGRLAAEVQRKEALHQAFTRYVSPRLAERVIAGLDHDGAPFGVEAQRVNVVALFADLRGFTHLTERTAVDEVVTLLNQYFNVITEAAYREEGTIFGMAGDALLVGFNVPFPQADAAARAWRAARDMVQSFQPVLAAWVARGRPPTGVGIGIASGEAILGNIGSPHFMSHTIIGDAVNTAARLVHVAKPGEVLVAGPVYQAIRAMVPAGAAEALGEVPLRGKTEATPVYSLRLP
ncbi:MAG TPA: response regulator [Burkholderiales bacterium]